MITYSFANKHLNHAFHISGQNFTLTYQFNHANISDSGFLFFVSAVTKTNSYISNGCKAPNVNTTSQTTIYTNADYVNGYPSYQKCISDVTVPVKHEARLYITEYNFEGISDTLILKYGNSQSIPLTWWQSRKVPYFYKLTSDINAAHLAFASDGNTQGAGYTAYLETYECTCSNSNFVIQCGNSADLTPMNFINQYCSNMDCNYTVIVL
uniref:CUB domain-containing protein n=1 Tax=Panagrolaimus superbus TaxID=310955 RepID=A0A914YXK4_9BILA